MDKFVVDPKYRFTLDESWKPNPLLAEAIARDKFGCPLADVAVENMPQVVMSVAFHHFGDRVPPNTPYSVTMPHCDNLTFNLIKQADGEIGVEYESLTETFGTPPEDINYVVPPGASYAHPKADMKVIEGEECLNMAGLYSMLIDALINPQDTNDNGQKAESILSSLLVQKLPGRSAIAIIQQIKNTRNVWVLNRIVDDLLAAD